ncbi:MAG: YqjD family protein [Bdellovibrionales bacterium]
MSERKSAPHNLSDAIRRLEKATNGNGQSHSPLSEDIENIKKALEDLKPHLHKLKNDAGAAAAETFDSTVKHVRETFDKSQESVKDMGKELDRRVHENPWWALGIVGLIAFLIGYLLGRKD